MKLSSLVKKSVAAFAVLSLMSTAALAFSEGVDYVSLEKPIAGADKTLIKVFSYDCPFCYKYDKSVTPKVIDKLSGIKFQPYHLSTKGKYGKFASELFAVLIIKDEAANVGLTSEDSSFKKAKFAYYKAYHDKKERWADGANVDAFLQTGLEAAGISKDEFEKSLKDERVQALLSAWGDKDGSAYEIAKIQGVPAFVVNGKYLILTKSITSIDSMVALINELSNK